MAACTLGVATPDTGATPNTSGAFTPAVGELLCVFVSATGTTDTAPTLVSSIGGFTFTLVTQATYNTSANRQYLFVADALVSSATSQTVTADTAASPSTGTCITVVRVSGMSKSGLTAVRQSGTENNKFAGDTPAPVFAGACLTGNPTLGAIAKSLNPATLTEPTGWTELSDIGYSSPTAGQEVVSRDSGFTGSTITWGSTFGNVGCTIIVELDASASGSNIKVIADYYKRILGTA